MQHITDNINYLTDLFKTHPFWGFVTTIILGVTGYAVEDAHLPTIFMQTFQIIFWIGGTLAGFATFWGKFGRDIKSFFRKIFK